MKPQIICHMMGPLDGQLVVSQWSPSTGRPAEELDAESNRIHAELEGDGWLCGRSTGEEFATADAHPPADAPAPERPIHVAPKAADKYAIFLDRQGKLHWPGPTATGDALIVVLGADVPDAHLAELAGDGISYIVCPDDRIDLPFVLDTLATRFDIKRLLLEGGAHTNAAFLEAGLVDEISLVLFPAIGGRSGATTLFEAGPEGLADKVRLTMMSTEMRRSGAVHLRYRLEYRS